MAFLKASPKGFRGQMSVLYGKLNMYKGDTNWRSWPGSPTRLSTELSRVYKPLAALGITCLTKVDRRRPRSPEADQGARASSCLQKTPSPSRRLPWNQPLDAAARGGPQPCSSRLAPGRNRSAMPSTNSPRQAARSTSMALMSRLVHIRKFHCTRLGIIGFKMARRLSWCGDLFCHKNDMPECNL
jgi:hypothetical protein